MVFRAMIEISAINDINYSESQQRGNGETDRHTWAPNLAIRSPIQKKAALGGHETEDENHNGYSQHFIGVFIH